MKLYVLMENVRSKFNVGAIFRTAEAFAFDSVILTGFTPTPPDKDITKTAIGAEEGVSWSYWQDPFEAVRNLKERGVKIIVAEVDKDAVKLPKFNLENKEGEYCIILGNEISGVSREIIQHYADVVIEIPMLGKIKESLNVEVSFAILASWARFNGKQKL